MMVSAALSGTALAAQFFVATNGNDAAAGTSAAPWRTLQRAANVVNPGDLVTVRPGNYAGFNLTRDGTPAAPIKFFAEPGVLINQPNPVRTDQGINLENASHVVIDGFAVTGMQKAGVRSVGVDGDTFASHVTIRNVRSYNNGYWGILTGFVNDLLIENNETWGSAVEHGIYVSNSGDRPIIRNNIVFDNRGNGIHMNGDFSLGGDGLISNAVVSGNLIYNNAKLNDQGVPGGGSGINMDGVQNSRIENNLLYFNHASGISLYSIDGAAGSSGNVVVNNTVYQAADGRWALNIQNASTNNTVRNNILIHPGSRGAIDISTDSRPGFTSDYNVVNNRFTTGGSNQTLAQWQALTGQDTHSAIATAAQLFINPTAPDLKFRDYHLLPGAIAVNAGTSFQAPTVDIDGNVRPINSLFDIGADETGPALVTSDFNSDGIVNTADYIAWKTSGRSWTAYQLWRSNFGAIGAAAAGDSDTIPEPDAFALIWIGVLAALYQAVILGRVGTDHQLHNDCGGQCPPYE
jgi:parallel beta-helix repeat protein